MGTSRVNQISRHFGTNEPGNEPAESTREKGGGGGEGGKKGSRAILFFLPFRYTRRLSTLSIPLSSSLFSLKFPKRSRYFPLFLSFVFLSHSPVTLAAPTHSSTVSRIGPLSRLHPFQYLQTITHSCSRGAIINYSLDAAETMVECISRPRVYSWATAIV